MSLIDVDKKQQRSLYLGGTEEILPRVADIRAVISYCPLPQNVKDELNWNKVLLYELPHTHKDLFEVDKCRQLGDVTNTLVDYAWKNLGDVMLACRSGKHRSVAMAMNNLRKRKGGTWKETFLHIKKRRPCASPIYKKTLKTI